MKKLNKNENKTKTTLENNQHQIKKQRLKKNQ